MKPPKPKPFKGVFNFFFASTILFSNPTAVLAGDGDGLSAISGGTITSFCDSVVAIKPYEPRKGYFEFLFDDGKSNLPKVIIHVESFRQFNYDVSRILVNKTICLTGKIQFWNEESLMVIGFPSQVKVLTHETERP